MIAILAPIAFIPMIVAVIYFRNTEKFEKEKWFSIIIVFLWGALIATGLSIVIENTISDYVRNIVILSVIVAPFVEEITKPIVLRFVKKEINEIEDGLIFGAVAGFGFAATENLIYGLRYWDEGLLVLISLFYIRTIGTSMLHASATAITGYGYSFNKLNKKSIVKMIPYLLFAVLLHGLFNVFAMSAQTINQIISVVIAVLLALSLVVLIRKKIILLDTTKPIKQAIKD